MNARFKTRLGAYTTVLSATLAIAAVLLPTAPAHASPLACRFENRIDDFSFRNLPTEIVGFVNCLPSDASLNIIYTARVKTIEPSAVLDWFKSYEKIVSPGTLNSRIVEKSTVKGLSWFEIESAREFGKTTHYLFTARAIDGTEFVLIYTDTEERAHARRARIKSLKSVLEKSEYISMINAAIPDAK